MRTLVCAALLLSACAKKVAVNPPEVHQTFVVEPIDGVTSLVSAYGAKGEADAKAYLCTTAYICTYEPVPIRSFKLTRIRK